MDEQTTDEVRKKRIARLGGGTGESNPKKGTSKTPTESNVGPVPSASPDCRSLSKKEPSIGPDSMEVDSGLGLQDTACISPKAFQNAPVQLSTPHNSSTTPRKSSPTSLSNKQKHKIVIDALAAILQVKLDGTDAILPNAPLTIDSCSTSEGELDVKELVNQVLYDVVHYSINSMVADSSQVLLSLSNCFGTSSKYSQGAKRLIAQVEDLVTTELKEQSTCITLAILEGSIPIGSESTLCVGKSLAEELVKRNYHWDMFCHMVALTCKDKAFFDKLFSPMLIGLMEKARGLTLVSKNYLCALNILKDLLLLKDSSTGSSPFVNLVVNLENWLPAPVTTDTAGIMVQNISFLGAFLGLSTFAEDTTAVADTYFSTEGQDARYLTNTNAMLRSNLKLARLQMCEIILTILRVKETRPAVLSLLATFLEANGRRSQIQVDERKVATDGFMLNLLSCLHELSIDKISVSKIDGLYLYHPQRKLKVADCSRLKATEAEVEKWIKAIKPEEWIEPKFPTECFFFTLRCISLSIIPNIRKYRRRIRVIRELASLLKDLEKSRDSWQSNAALKYRNERQMQRWNEQLANFKRAQLCSDTSVLDPDILSRTIRFYGLSSLFLLQQVGCNLDLPKLPLAASVPMAFASLPEYIIDDMADFILFIEQNMPVVLTEPLCCRAVADIVTLLVVLVCSPSYIKNPYLTAKLVEIIFTADSNISGNTCKDFSQQIYEHTVALDHLMPSLMRFYVDIESTGSHTEFFDKFGIRYQISIIFKSLWCIKAHKAQFIRTASTEKDDFTRFVNMLTNDTTFLLDESLDSLKAIHELQDLMNSPTKWNQLNRETQQAKERRLSQEEKQCRSYLTLGSETVEMFRYLTEYIKLPFLTQELADRLAAMLNFNVKQLCGPKCKNLVVRNAEKYSWEPKKLLDDLTAIYSNLDCEIFAAALANDERSYSDSLFTDAVSKMTRANIKSTLEIEKFTNLGKKVNKILADKQQNDMDWSDAPERFKDPLMDTLMLDPVLLPTSNIVMDRKHILRQLLNKSEDPFNRKELKVEDLVEDKELKKEIEDWVRSRAKRLRTDA
ncbi:ubiquitin conjugation factor E4 B-like [Watersipora subatra]|uniref:ubiquitin conjugation factor E4 B-like n=1 Tax=Watersipora subatra TaxID=2589382 RepID=UPI00355BE573